jgi:SAM-dependent methyltransferase
VRYLPTRYLDDGRGYNHGQPVQVVQIEDPEDYDALLAHIVETDYYGEGYLDRHSGQVDERFTDHFWWIGEAIRAMAPRSVLELGCGRGDVLLVAQHVTGAQVSGIDFGNSARSRMWPTVAPGFRLGDIVEVLESWDGPSVDLVCGFDIWEHLHPSSLDRCVELVMACSTPDARFFFVVPAFGDDAVFGEVFPLELEENRPAFERREPFRYLIADKEVPTIPAAGHLTWAHTDWWTELFERHGLRRCVEDEQVLHQVLDPMVPASVRAFYVFAKEGATPAPLRRHRHPTAVVVASLIRRRMFERRSGTLFIQSSGEELRQWLGSRPDRRHHLLLVAVEWALDRKRRGIDLARRARTRARAIRS